MCAVFMYDGIAINLQRKNIKNIYLAIRPPDGEVRISAPFNISQNKIEAFINVKIGWIKKHVDIFRQNQSILKYSYIEMEKHPLWGQYYPLRIFANSKKSYLEFADNFLNIYIRGRAAPEKIKEILNAGYGKQILGLAPSIIELWRIRFSLPPVRLCIRHMKSRWGSCTRYKGKITLNAELAKRTPIFLEYVIVHELAHFFVPNHGNEFIKIMDQNLPEWKNLRKTLNHGHI